MMRSQSASLLLVALLMTSVASANVIFVDDDAPDGGDGSTWSGAIRFLQDAIARASDPRNNVTEIRVAQGTYQPDRTMATPDGSGARDASFALPYDVTMLGGFAGIGAKDPDERSISAYETILNGDLLNNDEADFSGNRENSYHVVTIAETYPISMPTVSGVTILGGNADGPSPHDVGGGVRCESFTAPLFLNCTFRGNSAANVGGGIAIGDFNVKSFGFPMFLDSQFIQNRSSGGGAGIACARCVDPTIVKCLLLGNESSGPGGAILLASENSSQIVNTKIIGNAASSGGGIYDEYGFPRVTNCLISGNVAQGVGGGIRMSDSEATVINCTIENNTAERGGAVSAALLICFGSDQLLANCILWNNTATEGEGPAIYLDNLGDPFYCGSMTVTYSDVEGGESMVFDSQPAGAYALNWGPGNLDADPRFVSPSGSSGASKDNGNGGVDLRLSPGSPCIDAGDNHAVPLDTEDVNGDGNTEEPLPVDLAGQPRFVDDPNTVDSGAPDQERPVVDLGAYEFQVAPACPADRTGDMVVDIRDLNAVIIDWGCTDVLANCPGDVDQNGVVNVLDLLEILLQWGACATE